jgi:hypothetical protein
MQMIKELDTIVLTIDLPGFGLHAGDLGTVVLVHKHGGYEVEFVTLVELGRSIRTVGDMVVYGPNVTKL